MRAIKGAINGGDNRHEIALIFVNAQVRPVPEYGLDALPVFPFYPEQQDRMQLEF